MDERCIPQGQNKAYVSPIFKKGDRNKAENYRPINLTSIVCKLIESFVEDSLMTHMRAEIFLSSKQYGFINRRSTSTQLLSYLGVVDTIYFEFAKVFDSVPHERLLSNIKSYCTNGKVLEWIKTFLSNRRQIVNVNRMKSDPATVLSGILKRSVLGPILFVIYINDLSEVGKCATYLFADDTKIFLQITTKEYVLQTQPAISSLEQWSKKWLLIFNTKNVMSWNWEKFIQLPLLGSTHFIDKS